MSFIVAITSCAAIIPIDGKSPIAALIGSAIICWGLCCTPSSAAGARDAIRVVAMSTTASIVDDLRAESDALDALVSPLPAADWSRSTPAPGWTIAHQIAHLLWTDRVALTSITDESAFGALLADAAANPFGFVDAAAEEPATLTAPADLLADWRTTRGQLHEALRTVADGRKLMWFGPPMSAASMATARLMETWAHGLDVADTLGVNAPPTDRLKAIAHLGCTRDFAFTVHGLTRPLSRSALN